MNQSEAHLHSGSQYTSAPARLDSIMLSIIIMGIIASQKHSSIMPE